MIHVFSMYTSYGAVRCALCERQVIDVVEYLAHEGLPDEGCMPYSATDYKHLGIKKHERCPAIHMCTNCMPDEHDESKDDCWAVKKPVIYKVTAKTSHLSGVARMLRVVVT